MWTFVLSERFFIVFREESLRKENVSLNEAKKMWPRTEKRVHFEANAILSYDVLSFEYFHIRPLCTALVKRYMVLVVNLFELSSPLIPRGQTGKSFIDYHKGRIGTSQLNKSE